MWERNIMKLLKCVLHITVTHENSALSASAAVEWVQVGSYMQFVWKSQSSAIKSKNGNSIVVFCRSVAVYVHRNVHFFSFIYIFYI